MQKQFARSSLLTNFRLSYRLVTVALILAAVGYQFIYSNLNYTTFSAWNFFSFFTIQSNLIAVGALTGLVFVRREKPGLAIFRGAATLYMAITGIVFALLLANADVQLTLPWVDLVLHKLAPIIVVADWLFDAPRYRFAMRDISWWFVYPLLWLGYTLIRGPLVGWYPYPFLDPARGGYGTVALYGVGILVLGMVVSAALVWLARWSNTIAKRSR